MNIELLLYPFILNFIKDDMSFNKILILFLLYIVNTNRYLITDYLFKKIKRYFYGKENTLLYTIGRKDVSFKTKSLLWYISKLNHPSINKLKNISEFNYDYDSSNEKETSNIYQIDQYDNFKINKDINGRIFYTTKKIKNDIRESSEEITNLEIYSYTLSTLQLINWVEIQVEKYSDHLKTNIFNKQSIFTIRWNNKEDDIDISHKKWSSYSTFENSYLENKKEILEELDNWIKNPEFFKERGIPYTLGYLLHGKPGGGKTRFIKQLVNYTGKHALIIKLTKKFKFSKLQDILLKDQIGLNYIIPLNQRITIFEDFDAISDEVKDREKKKILDPEKKEYIIVDNNDNENNLSDILNVIDGIEERTGSIIVITTNKPKDLDPALIRPGRIDREIEFKNISNQGVYQMLKYYWKDKMTLKLKQINCDRKYTAAEIIQICRTTKNFNDIISKFN